MAPVACQGGDQVAHLAGALRVQAVGRLVEDQQVARRQERGGDGQPLAHPQGVRAVPLAGRREQPDPVEGSVDPSGGRAGVGVPVGGVQPREVRPTRQVGVERRALHE